MSNLETLTGGSSILCQFSRLSRQLHYQPDEEVATLARTSYQTWGRVIDDHVLGFFYPVCSWNCIPTFQLNFNPRPRRVARIIRGYIDQSMLAPTESRTILPIEGCERLVSGPIAVLTTWRLRAKHAWHRFFVDVKKNLIHPDLCGLDKHHGSRHLWDTTCPPPTIVNPLECAIVDTRERIS